MDGIMEPLSSFEQQFTDQLTCSACLDQYTNPKTLPCHHSFCMKCIEEVPVETKDGKYYISCRTCRVYHLLPQGGKMMLAMRKPSLQSTCPKHNCLLSVYCETCDQVICPDCIINSEHNKHIFNLISDCYPKHHQQILDNLDIVNSKLADMNTAITYLDTREQEVIDQGEKVKEKINTHAQQLIDNIQQSKTHLTQQVDTIVQQKTQTLATQKQQAQKLQTQLKTCQDMIEHSLKEWNQQQILTQKNAMMDEMITATQQAHPSLFKALEAADIAFKPIDMKDYKIGAVATIPYGKATLDLRPCPPNQPSTATLTLWSKNCSSFFSLPNSLVSSTFSTPGKKRPMKCPINQTQPGKYDIVFTPSTRKDQLTVQVQGIDIPCSPLSIPVLFLPETRGEPLRIIEGINGPRGLAVSDNGDIVVAESIAHCVTILNGKDYRRVRSFGDKDDMLKYPRRVAISNDGHILVTDNHRLQKLTTDGICVKSVGTSTSGSGQLYLNFPSGIAVHPTTGEVFVTDSNNDRIQVFTDDLTLSHTITPSHQHSRPYHFNDIAIDSTGYYLYITDYNNHCVVKYSGKGDYIDVLGFKPGQLSHPTSIFIDGDLIYVGEEVNKCISVFDTAGNLTYRFGRKMLQRKLDSPTGIAMNAYGHLFVSDTYNNRIIIF